VEVLAAEIILHPPQILVAVAAAAAAVMVTSLRLQYPALSPLLLARLGLPVLHRLHPEAHPVVQGGQPVLAHLSLQQVAVAVAAAYNH
jgi:flagellar biosynthesis protein FliR